MQQCLNLTSQAFRFGVQDPEALKAIDMAFELAPAPSSDVYKGAMKTLTLVRSHKACLLTNTCGACVDQQALRDRVWQSCVYVKDTPDYTDLLPQAIRKHQRSTSKGEGPIEPHVHIPDPSSVRCTSSIVLYHCMPCDHTTVHCTYWLRSMGADNFGSHNDGVDLCRIPPLPPLFNTSEVGASLRRDSGSSDGAEL
jgi:hypothetical protein